MNVKLNVYEIITQKIIESLESGVAPWHQPWSFGSIPPMNFATKRPYSGINRFLLVGDYELPYFMTFNQVKERGGFIKAGAKSEIVVFWSPIKPKIVSVTNDETGEEEEMIDSSSLGKFVLKYYRVFNARDIEGIEFPQLEECKFGPITKCEEIVNGFVNGPRIEHGYNKAFYLPSEDLIGMPSKRSFDSAEWYYATLFHEMVHSTGHQNRLSRKGVIDRFKFGSHEYSQEELVAEMGAAFLCAEAGIENVTLDNTTAYIDNWLQALQNDKKMVVIAASQAEKAARMILGAQAVESLVA